LAARIYSLLRPTESFSTIKVDGCDAERMDRRSRTYNVGKLADYFEFARVHYWTELTLDIISGKFHRWCYSALCIILGRCWTSANSSEMRSCGPG